jgi:hypothetical protein
MILKTFLLQKKKRILLVEFHFIFFGRLKEEMRKENKTFARIKKKTRVSESLEGKIRCIGIDNMCQIIAIIVV